MLWRSLVVDDDDIYTVCCNDRAGCNERRNFKSVKAVDVKAKSHLGRPALTPPSVSEMRYQSNIQMTAHKKIRAGCLLRFCLRILMTCNVSFGGHFPVLRISLPVRVQGSATSNTLGDHKTSWCRGDEEKGRHPDMQTLSLPVGSCRSPFETPAAAALPQLGLSLS